MPKEEDEIYITGNQESLGNWEPDQVKMKRISLLEREITLKVQDHVELKFTRGYLASEAWLKISGGQSNFPMIVRPEDGEEYSFEVTGYMN